MTSVSEPPSSPKRPLPAMEASSSDTTKKLKLEDTNDDLAARLQTLPKKERKKYHRAKKLGQRVDIENGKLILHPKVHIRHHRDFASFNDIRTLILGTMLHDIKLPKGMEFYEREKLSKCVVLDMPMLDPSTTDEDDDHYYHTLSKSILPPPVYNQWNDPTQPYASFLHHLGIHVDDDDCEAENDAFGKVASGLCDRRKGLVNRFSQIVQCHLTKSQVKQYRKQADEQKDNAVSAEELMLTRQEMINENYPLHSSVQDDNRNNNNNNEEDDDNGALPEGWIETPAGKQGTKTSKKLLAMDCEMCRSGRRLVLTKVALVDEDHRVLLNEFVMPDCPITDYVTDYSGVDEASLQGVTTTLQDIQQQLLQYIDDDTILVGHGLVNDLRVLKMRHPHIIDTSVIYHHKNGPPYKASLKDLTTFILQRQIQENKTTPATTTVTTTTTTTNTAARGHDPCEDAIASMELVQLKIKKGLKFGLHSDYLTELMVERLKRHGKSGVMIDVADDGIVHDTLLAKELLKGADCDEQIYTTASDNQAAMALALEHHAVKDLVLLKLSNNNGSATTTTTTTTMDQVKWLYDQLDKNTALIMLAGNNKTEELDRLRKKWCTYKADLKTRPLDEIPENERWTEEDEQRLDTLVELAKRYYIIPSIKF
ncbi:hypothetical protein BCR42DRAFT_421173 [Absidia repens]|uniref:Exonuclease domain-containing protein n=1 Tax=Absidia repens TaxID=90262 RepID=A0A1X2I873_9FUNG|nr:hypothetical protein BCR42DRAFT_421173 [Absidia repens]